jgi:hypothetical protein
MKRAPESVQAGLAQSTSSKRDDRFRVFTLRRQLETRELMREVMGVLELAINSLDEQLWPDGE